MMSVLISVLAALRGLIRSRAALHLEVLALRHQLQVLQRSGPRRLRLARADRWLWAWPSPGLPLILDMEKSPTPRATARRPRCPRLDSDDVGAQSVVGSATHSR